MPAPILLRTLLQPTRTRLLATTLTHHALPSARLLLPTYQHLPQHRFAHGDYGSGSGDPKGEKPQEQGASESEHLEHPGPPPPDVGKGSGGTNTSGDGGKASAGKGSADEQVKTSEEPSGSGPSSGSSSSSDGKSSSTSASATHSGGGGSYDHSDTGKTSVKSGAQPKFNLEPPQDVDQADVKRHNDEVDQRKAKAKDYGGDVGDEVGKGFWSGGGTAEKKI